MANNICEIKVVEEKKKEYIYCCYHLPNYCFITAATVTATATATCSTNANKNKKNLKPLKL